MQVTSIDVSFQKNQLDKLRTQVNLSLTSNFNSLVCGLVRKVYMWKGQVELFFYRCAKTEITNNKIIVYC